MVTATAKTTPSASELASRWGVSKTEAKRALYEASRVSNVVQWAYGDEPLYDYQRAFLDDHSTRLMIIKKCRGSGFSSRMSVAKGVIKALSIPRYMKIFTSYNIHDRKEKIEYANDLYDRIVDLKSFADRVPAKDHDSVTELKFSNGARLVSLFVPEGKHNADVDLDEFSLLNRPRKIYKAAMPILLKGGQGTVAGRPASAGHMFSRMFAREGGKFTNMMRQKIYWWDCALHCIDVKRARIEAPAMSTEERVEKFGSEAIKFEFDAMFLEDFQQHFELDTPDDERAFLSWDLITECTPLGEDAVETASTPKELAALTKGNKIFAGYDVGRTRDKGELSVFELRDGHFYERFSNTLDRERFAAQEEAVASVAGLENCKRARIDETGLGMDLAERLAERFQGCEGLTFTQKSKAQMASNMRSLMELGLVHFEPSPDKRHQMHAVKKEVTTADSMRLVVKQEAEEAAEMGHHHADVFWARALALWAWKDDGGYGEPKAWSV